MHLADKLAALSEGVNGLVTDLEAKADALIARKAAVAEHATKVFATHGAVLDATEKAVASLETALGQVSNGGPA